MTQDVRPEVEPAGGDALVEALHENAQLKRQLAQATDELESFTYSVSHDLRASLRHISAFVEIVNEDWNSSGLGKVDAALRSDIGGHLATITDAARHMTLMIDALMELSRLGRVELNLSRVEVRPLIDEVCAALQPQPIQWRIANDFPLLHADPVLVRQLLQHLISNAIKFTGPAAGRPAPEIEIGWRWLPDQQCELFVKDNGVGFNPKFGGKLFGVFQRLHSASEFEGIGMGLALSRRIVERHGGRIAATSPAPVSASATGCSTSHSAPPPQYTGGCEVRFALPAVAAY